METGAGTDTGTGAGTGTGAKQPMLWLRARNVYTDIHDQADYTISVGVNDTPIWNGTILKHPRQDGAAALLRRIAERMEREKVR